LKVNFIKRAMEKEDLLSERVPKVDPFHTGTGKRLTSRFGEIETSDFYRREMVLLILRKALSEHD
jgi:hypothetical protein